MVKFKDDEFLGKTVKNTRLYCSIGVEPIKDMFQLRYAGGGNKFSSLCGFMFDTAAEGAEFPRFMISFVCKLRSKIYRQQQHNPSQWFIFRRINKNRVDVLDKKALLVNYGFDIDKFFDSDLFKSSLPKFEKCLKKGLEDAESFAKGQKEDAIQKECGRYIKSISESLPIMMQSKRVNDKYFQLNDLDAIAKDASAGISADAKKKALDAKLDAIHKGAEGSMASAARYDKKFTANDYIYKKLHGEDEKVDEARNPKDYKCKVEKTKEDGKDAWKVYEISTNMWVATFFNETIAKKFAEEEYPELKAKYLDSQDEFIAKNESEKTKVDEASVDYEDQDEITIDAMMKQAKKLYPNNSDGGKSSPIVGIVDGHLADFIAFTFAKHEGHPDPGTFFLHDGKKASLDALAEQLEVGSYNESVEKDEKQVEEDDADKLKEKELDDDIEESLKEIYS